VSVREAAIGVVLWRRPETVADEWRWGQDVCRRMLVAELGAPAVAVHESPLPPTVGDLLARVAERFVGVVLDDVSFWGEGAWASLRQALERTPSVALAAPVSNEAVVERQREGPPFVYQTPSVLRRASAEHRRRHADEIATSDRIDPFAMLVRREELESLDRTTPASEIPVVLGARGRALGIARDVYVHRYARVHDQPRPDLQERIPRDARTLLDVGCATGELGAAVKRRQPCRVVGIELNPNLAAAARERIDLVLEENVERIPGEAHAAEFDCIVCGDVLEHLVDPWAMVEKLASWLRPGGTIVATLPNVGHWSLVADLVAGRWDLIPFGLLCFSHLRFFTRPGIEHLFSRGGLEIEAIVHLKDGLPPVGEDFVGKAAALVPDADRESLETNEFLIVARRRV
jgi:2-polyprenyl-3-methyl-5-hydroxy-6-metoxy-1,4-benzoquinol methylase